MRTNSSSRPFRIWDAATGKNLPGRCYKHERNAHNAALVESSWSNVKQTLEVVDVSRGNKLIGQYTRQLKGVSVWRE